MIDLGLIIDVTNPIPKMEKLGTLLINEAYGAGGANTAGFTDMGDTPTEISQLCYTP